MNGSTHRDETEPSGPWTFDGSVAEVFDDMLLRSIPDYLGMREAVTTVVVAHVHKLAASDEQPLILDLGASRGTQVAELARVLGPRARFCAVDNSQPMLGAARAELRDLLAAGSVDLRLHDLRRGLPDTDPPSVILSVLTLMFIPLEHRQRLVREAYEALAPGGALVLVEKVLGADAELQGLLAEHYHAMKVANGYSEAAVAAKAASLEGVLVPLTTEWNHDMLRRAGFTVDLFWARWCFRAWLALKPGNPGSTSKNRPIAAPAPRSGADVGPVEARDAPAIAARAGIFRRPAAYEDRLRDFVSRTDEKEVLAAGISAVLRTGTLLDIGAGAGQLARLLGVSSDSYTGIERNPELARRLRGLGYRVIEGHFPATELSEQYDNVLMSYALPWTPRLYTPLLIAAWGCVRSDGRLIVAGYRDCVSDYTMLLDLIGEVRRTDDARHTHICATLAELGDTEVRQLRSHIRGTTITELVDSLAFVATNNSLADSAKRDRVRAALMAHTDDLAKRYASPQGGYAFPIDHYLITCDKQ